MHLFKKTKFIIIFFYFKKISIQINSKKEIRSQVNLFLLLVKRFRFKISCQVIHNPFFHVSIILLRGPFCVIIWESSPSLVFHTIVFAMKVKMGKILLYPLLFLCNEMRLFRNKKKGVISTTCTKKKKKKNPSQIKISLN